MKDGFAFNPDDAPARLFRYTSLYGNQVSLLDAERNLLLIDKEKFDRLTKKEQHQVLRTHARFTYITELQPAELL